MVQLSFWKPKMLKASKIKTGTSSLESDQRQHLSMCFDKLMTNINLNLDSKNRDKFARI